MLVKFEDSTKPTNDASIILDVVTQVLPRSDTSLPKVPEFLRSRLWKLNSLETGLRCLRCELS